MHQSVLQRRVVLGGLVAGAVVVAGLLLSGLMGGGGSNTPYAVVEAIYQHCQAGEPEQTGRYYAGRPAGDAEMRANLCLKITQANSIKGWEVISQATGNADAAIVTHNLRDGDDGRTLKWTLTRKRGRWLVEEVV